MPTRGHEFYLLVFNSISHSFARVSKISEHFPKSSEDFRKFSEDYPKFIRTFLIIIFSENVRRLPKVAEYFRAIFEDVSII